MTKISVRLWAAYLEEPVTMRNAGKLAHFEVRNLPISTALQSELLVWDEEYQNTFDSEYPPDSDFKSSDLRDAHNERGMELSAKLQDELGTEYEVEFKPV